MAIILSVAIVFVLSSLLTLIYLTMRSYRNLTQLNLQDDTCNEDLVGELPSHYHINGVAKNVQFVRQSEALVQQVSNLNAIRTGNTKCLCHFESGLIDSHHQGDPSLSNGSCNDLQPTCTNLVPMENLNFAVINNGYVGLGNELDMSKTLYEAHTHNIDETHHYACHSVDTSDLVSRLPSEDKCDNYPMNQFEFTNHPQELSGCCHSAVLPNLACQPDGHLRVNMVENPLDTGEI